MRSLLALLMLLMTIGVVAVNVEAASVGSHSVGLTLSKSCQTMLLHNVSTACPTYDDLIQLDNSNQDWSGYFIYNENGLLFREAPKQPNTWRLYDHDNEWRVFVDPPQGMHERIKLITIHPNFDDYLPPGSKTILLNNTIEVDNVFSCNKIKDPKCVYEKEELVIESNPYRIVYHHRYVDDKCWNATINASLWETLVADTIFYMRNSCDESSTSFDEREEIPIDLTKHDITTTQKYKDEQRLEYVKQHCIFKFKSCEDIDG